MQLLPLKKLLGIARRYGLTMMRFGCRVLHFVIGEVTGQEATPAVGELHELREHPVLPLIVVVLANPG
jgi:hypothetical protein